MEVFMSKECSFVAFLHSLDYIMDGDFTAEAAIFYRRC
jgi:hypothetical protein